MKGILRIVMSVAVVAMMAVPGMAQRHNHKAEGASARPAVVKERVSTTKADGKDHAKWKEMQEFKLKYLAQEMQLKENQQKRFFELYTKMSEEKHKVYKDARHLERKLKEQKNVTDADYAAVSRALTDSKKKEAEIEKKYDKEFQKFLSSKQIFKMKEAEEAFRARMHEMRGKRR